MLSSWLHSIACFARCLLVTLLCLLRWLAACLMKQASCVAFFFFWEKKQWHRGCWRLAQFHYKSEKKHEETVSSWRRLRSGTQIYMFITVKEIKNGNKQQKACHRQQRRDNTHRQASKNSFFLFAPRTQYIHTIIAFCLCVSLDSVSVSVPFAVPHPHCVSLPVSLSLNHVYPLWRHYHWCWPVRHLRRIPPQENMPKQDFCDSGGSWKHWRWGY